MLKTSLLTLLWAASFASAQTPSKAPSADTLALSLKTIGKALAGCREVYTRAQTGTKTPLLKAIISPADYDKDLASLTHAETFANAMIAHPERVSGKTLVALLSSVDDFSVGVGSTRTAILGSLITATRKPNAPSAEESLVMSTALDSCQKSLFNAGDDFVDIVMNYVGAEDDAVAVIRASKAHSK